MSVATPRPAGGRRVRRTLIAAVVAALSGATFVAVAASASAAPAATAGLYHPIAPQRVLDTRVGSSAALGPGRTGTFDVSSAVTEQADSVVLNVTTVNATADGYLTLFPGDADRPATSSVRHLPGVAGSTSVTVGVANLADGRRLVKVFNSSGTTDLVIDVFGWYLGDAVSTTPSPAAYYPLPTPIRTFDSRNSGGPFVDGRTNVFHATADIDGTDLLGVSAVAINITAVVPDGTGYLQAWNGTGAAPTASSVNFVRGRTTANFAVVPVTCTNPSQCTQYSFAIRNKSAGTNVVVDLLGYYATPKQAGATAYRSFTPYRVVDTRTSTPFGRLGPGTIGVAPIGDSAGTDAVAANLTVTAVAPSLPTYLTVFHDGGNRATSSTLNAPAGLVTVNATQTAVTGKFGQFIVYNYAGSTNVVVDVDGAFFPQ